MQRIVNCSRLSYVVARQRLGKLHPVERNVEYAVGSVDRVRKCASPAVSKLNFVFVVETHSTSLWKHCRNFVIFMAAEYPSVPWFMRHAMDVDVAGARGKRYASHDEFETAQSRLTRG